jgi:hypothetical protein
MGPSWRHAEMAKHLARSKYAVWQSLLRRAQDPSGLKVPPHDCIFAIYFKLFNYPQFLEALLRNQTHALLNLTTLVWLHLSISRTMNNMVRVPAQAP